MACMLNGQVADSNKYYTMRAKEVAGDYNLWGARVRVKNADFDDSVDVAVYAKTAYMAQQLIRAQYGRNAVISNVRKIA